MHLNITCGLYTRVGCKWLNHLLVKTMNRRRRRLNISAQVIIGSDYGAHIMGSCVVAGKDNFLIRSWCSCSRCKIRNF